MLCCHLKLKKQAKNGQLLIKLSGRFKLRKWVPNCKNDCLETFRIIKVLSRVAQPCRLFLLIDMIITQPNNTLITWWKATEKVFTSLEVRATIRKISLFLKSHRGSCVVVGGEDFVLVSKFTKTSKLFRTMQCMTPIFFDG